LRSTCRGGGGPIDPLGSTTRCTASRPPEFIDTVWRHWDKGTQRATLQLYRDANPDRLAAAGKNLNTLTCPALVLWGDRDPYLPTKFGKDYARTLPNAEFKKLQGAGHWPWLDDPTVVDQVLNFLG
jgi:pimeloyl-ACP methyl ester carboxylesterase